MNRRWSLATGEAAFSSDRASALMRTVPSVSRLRAARTAGAFYLLAVLSAVSGEAFLHGGWAIAIGLTAVACFVVVTLILYLVFEPVSSILAALAAVSNLAGLALEALELHLRGANIALIFHCLYCILIGLLISRSTFLPRVLGVLIIIGGLAWLTDLSIPLTNPLAPYNVVVGFLGEGLPMLWLLIVGARAPHWHDRVHAS